MNQRPIGVFDSGLGGLTAVRQLRRLMPSENIIYFGDTARVPYGNRGRETILKYARQDLAFLRSFDLKAVVVACGTVSTNCIDALQAESDVPITGVVEPAVQRAAELSRARRVGLVATRASVGSGAYERAFRQIDPGLEVYSLACPLFVPLVEEGRCRPGDVVIETVAEEYLAPLRERGLHPLSPPGGRHPEHHGPRRDAGGRGGGVRTGLPGALDAARRPGQPAGGRCQLLYQRPGRELPAAGRPVFGRGRRRPGPTD